MCVSAFFVCLCISVIGEQLIAFILRLQTGSKGFRILTETGVDCFCLCFSREGSPRGDQGLKTCLLALISNISTTTHLFCSICWVSFEGVIEVGFEVRSEAFAVAILDCYCFRWNVFQGYFAFFVTFLLGLYKNYS